MSFCLPRCDSPQLIRTPSVVGGVEGVARPAPSTLRSRDCCRPRTPWWCFRLRLRLAQPGRLAALLRIRARELHHVSAVRIEGVLDAGAHRDLLPDRARDVLPLDALQMEPTQHRAVDAERAAREQLGQAANLDLAIAEPHLDALRADPDVLGRQLCAEAPERRPADLHVDIAEDRTRDPHMRHPLPPPHLAHTPLPLPY